MIEDKVFQRKRPVIERLIQRGFRETPDGYRKESQDSKLERNTSVMIWYRYSILMSDMNKNYKFGF